MKDEQRTAAMFKWSGEIPGHEVERDPERLTTLTARAPAQAILNAVRKRGYLTDVQVPYEGEGGWHFAITIDGQIFGIFILWTAFGHPESHYFSIQVSLDRGVFAAMFRRDVRDERLEPVRRALEDVSGSVPLLSEFRWLTSAQFTSIE